VSKVCNERGHPMDRPAPCGKPAMTQYGGRFMCWGCRENYEEAAKQLIKNAPKKNPPRR
jgi:hypothetical protein